MSTEQTTDYQTFYQNVHTVNSFSILSRNFMSDVHKSIPMAGALPLLSPLQIKVASNSVLIELFDKLLEILVKAGWISNVYADRAQTEYADMIKNKKTV